MFRKVLILSLFTVALIGVPLRAEMANGNFGLDEVAENANYKAKDVVTPPTALFDTINKIVSGLLGITAIVFFGFLTYAGVRWMTAQGNEEFVTKAQETMKAAVIGLIIITAAYAVTNFVFTKLSAPPASDNLPPPPLPAGCPGIPTAADCQPPACQWNRAASFCEDASQQSSASSPAGSTSGVCLKVVAGQMYCDENTTQSECAAHGAGYSFYATGSGVDCGTHYLPLSGIP